LTKHQETKKSEEKDQKDYMTDCNHMDLSCLKPSFAPSIIRANSDLNLSFAA
jgi:hypothetical protein